MRYNYEKDRIKAFCIYNDKTYENDQHFECYLDILEELGLDREELFQLDDDNIKKNNSRL